MVRFADRPMAAWMLGAVALAIAAISAKPFAGGWNDAGRLAAVESLLERGTFAIDDSIFVNSTYDKLFAHGHFYSDKPAIGSLLIACLYRPLEWLGAPTPHERPDVFVRLITILTSGLGYAVATGCLWVIGRRTGLEPRLRFGWLAAFALCTYAPTYTQHVNSGAMQLGVLGVMAVLLTVENRWRTGNLVALGMLAGIGFNLDYGSGPPLVACLFALVWWQTRRFKSLAAFSVGVLPWVAAGIGINYAIAGVWKPLGMYPEFFLYPGSPFTEENLTGGLHHKPLNLLLYAGGMLFGKHGFLNHNLPLILLIIPGIPAILRGPSELKWLMAWCGLTWLMYAVLSNNMGGGCCSVRWFVPFLVPEFWLLARVLQAKPHLEPQFGALSAGGFVLAGLMWWKGPWTMNMVPFMWYVVGLTLIAWGVVAWRTRPKVNAALPMEAPLRMAA